MRGREDKSGVSAKTPLLSRGGVAATSRNNREATSLERTGWCWRRNLDQHHPVCAFKGGFAVFSWARSHPSSAEEGSFWSTSLRRIALLPALLILLLPTLAFADYRTFEVESLRITVDTDWPTTGAAGYFPVRFDITNLAEAREIEIAASVQHFFDPSRRRGGGPFGGTTYYRPDTGRTDVRQRIPLKRGDRVKFTFPIPVVADSENIDIRIRENGRNLDNSIRFFFSGGRILPEAPVVVVSSTQSSLGLNTIGLRPVVPRYGSPRFTTSVTPGPVSSAAPRMDVVLEPSRLPTSWLGYTGLRAVVLGPTEWNELDVAQKDALLTWTASGGDLIFADGSLDALLPPGQSPVGLKKTLSAVPWYLGNIHLLSSEDLRSRGLMGVIIDVDAAVATPDWSLPAVRTRDWGWMGERNFRVPIPGVGAVPMRSYLAILTLFVVLIGPVNYVYLWRRGRQVLMVLTVPLISAVFILLLSAYGVLSQGFDIRARAVTYTVLDQNSKKAATRASVSLFPGGISESGGVRFASDTAIMTLGSDGLGGREIRLDLTGEQRYTSGLLQPRTPGNYEQVWYQPARQRLNFERNGDEISVVNGLGATLKHLYYREIGGAAFSLDRPLAEGDRVSLKTATPESLASLVLNMREGITDTPIAPGKFQEIIDRRPEGTYIAVLEKSPFWDPGVEEAQEIGSLHVVLGFAGGQP